MTDSIRVVSSGGKNILIMEEDPGTSGVIVPMTLAKGGAIGDHFAGILTYNYNGEDIQIDVIDAQFGSAGSENDPGNVAVEITLVGTNTFLSPVMSSALPEHVAVVLKSGTQNTAQMSFTEPDSMVSPVPTELLFNTSEGVIDPSVEVERVPR